MQDKAAVSEEKAIARRMAERLLEGSEDKINRNIKDSVFCDLFGKKEYLLQLYKVLHPEDAETEEDDLTIVTLSRIFVREMYNDLGFMAGNKLIVLVEAQSSWSENITVRFLMYLGETYRRYIERNHLELYGTRRIPLPKPELYMVFTGERADRPERISLKRTFWESDDCCIDVTAHVIYDSRKGDILNQFIVFSRVFDEQRKLYPNDALQSEVLKIWIQPTDQSPDGKKVKNRFLVTVDVGGRGYRADWSVISVFDRISMASEFGALERAALWRGHVDPDLLAYKAAQIAHYYDDALLVIESNTYETKNRKSDDAAVSEGDHTYTVLDTLGGIYENLYRRRTTPDNTRDKETRHIGWHMNKQTKYMAYDDYTVRIREGDYMEYSQDAADEAMWLMNAPGGKIEAMEGTHDDIQDTTAVGCYIAFGGMEPVKIIEDAPRRASSVTHSHTGGESTF